MTVLSHRACTLGEGALWHPLRGQFFWFDILGKRLFTTIGETERSWHFDEHVSAAGWIDHDHLLIASATALWQFHIDTGRCEKRADLESDKPLNRSNDGRADPFGGFWIGTMGIKAEPNAGAIYRYYNGQIRQLYADITISNAICFAPDGQQAYFTDTAKGRILRQALDLDGWPKGDPVVFIDLSDQDFGPDGAVVDAQGNFWNAQWGAGRVACYSPDGTFREAIQLPTTQVTCPAFGGDDLTTLFVTTAAEGVSNDPMAGKTYKFPTQFTGQREHQVHVTAPHISSDRDSFIVPPEDAKQGDTTQGSPK
ncbi:sugar lactone lactonase YvrE [Pacificibacter maritimus]|uniref:Sugar lactone lactonase YvrE n=1 Tax=Pacificibacter maritimus TaxID=762213 RepID=A0A3N4UL42_9RHOB|nr:SMP-30/gluconolactonase/LRE family protein [Pacificibacter maritimus]RPE71366.1 sugar lactone lactonase YvrE [Pacificibacter maritimus]